MHSVMRCRPPLPEFGCTLLRQSSAHQHETHHVLQLSAQKSFGQTTNLKVHKVTGLERNEEMLCITQHMKYQNTVRSCSYDQFTRSKALPSNTQQNTPLPESRKDVQCPQGIVTVSSHSYGTQRHLAVVMHQTKCLIPQ